AFFIGGAGNGLAAANEQLLVQRTAPEDALGRVFGIHGTMISGAFGASFLLGGLLASLAGTRVLFLVAGAGLLCAWIWSAYGRRKGWAPEPVEAEAEPAAAFTPAALV